MTYAAEPYAQFVDDLLTALTGGVIRDELRFLPELEPFELSAGAVLRNSVRVFGLAGGAYTRFRPDTDFKITQRGSKTAIDWLDSTPGTEAVHPDPGSTFFVNYEHHGPAPALTDRNPGSITRLLAESFAREYATLSKQLEGVYQAGFLETASGRDLDQLAALVGVTRRRRLSASGSVVFSRTSPSPADIFIPAGTRLSTADAPSAEFETTEDRTLPRGALSASAPVAATFAGDSGVVAANAIRVMNRPILGIDAVGNPLATRLGGADETDALLRERCRRALETAGKATTGSLLGALTTLPGLREKDIHIAEDYLAHPGILYVDVAFPEMSPGELAAMRKRAVELIDATRPAGIRVVHNIDAPVRPAATAALTEEDEETEDDPIAIGRAPAGMQFLPVDVDVRLTPAALSISSEQRTRLTRLAKESVAAFLADAGVGGALVCNRLVAALMQLDGVLDADVRLGAKGSPLLRKNFIADNAAVKAIAGAITVSIGGTLVMLDVVIDLHIDNPRLGPPSLADTVRVALGECKTKLQTAVDLLKPGVALSPAILQSALPNTETYSVRSVHYQVDYVDAGVRIRRQDVVLPVTGLERFWIRNAVLPEGTP